jgi:hypothetical protein
MLTSFFKPFVVKGAFRFSELFGDKRVYYLAGVVFLFPHFFPSKIHIYSRYSSGVFVCGGSSFFEV